MLEPGLEDAGHFRVVEHLSLIHIWNFTSAKLQRRMEEIESSINRYLVELDSADRQEPAVAKLKTEGYTTRLPR